MRIHLHIITISIALITGSIPCFGKYCGDAEVGEVTTDSMAYSINEPDTLKSKALEEVTVTSRLHTTEGNKDIFTVTKSMCEGLNSSGELLGKIPGIMFNPLTEEIIVRGSKNSIILVNGIEKDESYIKRLRPERFDRIEIINNPTGIYAQYDVVINLHTKPSYTGYEGVVLSETSVFPTNSNGQGKNLRKSRSVAQFTYTNQKFNVDFMTNYTFEQQGLSEYFTQEYPLNGIIERTMESRNNVPNKNTRISRYTADLSLDYDLNSNHSFSARVSAVPSSSHDRQTYVMERTFTGINHTDTLFENRSNDDKDRLDLFGGIWYRGKLDRWTLNSRLTYTNIGYDRCNHIVRNTGYNLVDDRKIHSGYLTGAVTANYTSPNNKWLLSLSENMIFTRYREERLMSEELLSESNDFRNTFDASILFQGNQKYSFSANAGFSIFRNSYNESHDTYATPKFGVNMTWVPGAKAIVRFNYSASMSYPPLSALQNYGQFTDSLIYTMGNPNLKTSLNHDFTFSTTLFNSLSLDFRYSLTSNAIFRYFSCEEGLIPSGNYTYYTKNRAENGNSSIWKANITYNKAFGKHWLISLTGTVNGYRSTYRNITSSRVLPEYSWYAVYQIMKHNLQIYLSGYMEPYVLNAPQSDSRTMDEGNTLAVSKIFLDGRLQIVGMWCIPFNFSKGGTHGGIKSESFRSDYWANNQDRKNNMIQLTVLYRFNKGKTVKKYNRQSETIEL